MVLYNIFRGISHFVLHYLYASTNMEELEIKMNNKTLKQSPITIGDTTKKNKHEHGMGQAIIYDIVKKYNGKIKVYVMENRYYTEMVI